jgi:transcriptional regulator with XRE-family HTH domain
LPIKNLPPSTYVAAQVKNLRLRRGWSQQRLADRLNELLTETPEWVERLPGTDPRKPKPGSKETAPKWSQTRILKLERARLRVTVDDLFELALALDVSPLYLLTPALDPHPDDVRERWSRLAPGENDVFKVAVGKKMSFWPHDVRQWIRGVSPLLGAMGYRTNEDAMSGRLFYLVESQPLGEVDLIKDAGDYTEQMLAMRALLSPSDEGDDAE